MNSYLEQEPQPEHHDSKVQSASLEVSLAVIPYKLVTLGRQPLLKENIVQFMSAKWHEMERISLHQLAG